MLQIKCKLFMSQSGDFFLEVSIDYFYDTRRILNNGKYPLKIRIYDVKNKKNHILKTPYEFTKDEYKALSNRNNKALKNEIEINLTYCRELAKKIKPFDISIFKQKYLNKKVAFNSVEAFYKEKMTDLKNSGNIGTYNTYKDSLRSIELFLISKKKHLNQLTFDAINLRWIKEFEAFVVNDRGCSTNTLGIYLRNLRAIFNEAIKQNIIEKEVYPFGMHGYTIRNQKKGKRILSLNEIKLLEQTEPNSKSEIISKDFWLMSYYCCGMNLTDFAYLKKSNITDQEIKFFRRKTVNNKNTNVEIVIPIHDKSRAILNKLINPQKHHLFGIIEKDDTAEMKKQKIKQFNDVINKNFKKLTSGMINTESITLYNARHSWASHMLQMGAPISFIQEKLGHTDIKTTSAYIASFPIEAEKDYINKVFYGE